MTDKTNDPQLSVKIFYIHSLTHYNMAEDLLA